MSNEKETPITEGERLGQGVVDICNLVTESKDKQIADLKAEIKILKKAMTEAVSSCVDCYDGCYECTKCKDIIKQALKAGKLRL